MNKNKKNIFTIFITFMLLLTIFFIIILPGQCIVKASIGDRLKKVYTSKYVVDITYDENIAFDPLLPVDRIKEIPIYINVNVSGFYIDEMLDLGYNGTGTFADLRIKNNPEWATTTVFPYQNVPIDIREGGSVKQVSLIVEVDENAPAFSQEEIEIEVKIRGAGALVENIVTKKVKFIAGYIPLLDISVDKKTNMISPNELAFFNVNIKNLGNEKTILNLKTIDYEDWKIYFVEDSVTIESDETKNIKITVQSPQSFGYHDDNKMIKLFLKPSYFKNSSLIGDTYEISFIVQVKGFSTQGIELILMIVITLIIVLVVLTFIFKKFGNKIKKGMIKK